MRDIQYEMLAGRSSRADDDLRPGQQLGRSVERRGKLELTDVIQRDDAHLMKIIDKTVAD